RPGETRRAGDVERPVVRQDQVAGEARAEARGVDTASGQGVELVDQGRRVDDDAGPDDRDDVRIEDPRRDEVQLEHLVAEHDGVAGVVAALVADDEVGLLGEEVRGLALALVAPLQPDDDRGRHQARASTESKRPRNRGSETEIQVSRVRSASGSKTRRRLTGRATRLPRATAGLLSGRAGPRTVRGRGEYSSAAARHRTATARHGGPTGVGEDPVGLRSPVGGTSGGTARTSPAGSLWA